MTSNEKASLVFLFVLSPKMQEAMDDTEKIVIKLNRTKLLKAYKNLHQELKKVINVMYDGISEQEEEQLRTLTLAIDEGIDAFKKALKEEYDNELKELLKK